MSTPTILTQFYAAQRRFSRPENRKGIKLTIKDVPVSVVVPLYPDDLSQTTLEDVGKRAGCKSSSRHEMEDGVIRSVPVKHTHGKEGEGMVNALFALVGRNDDAPSDAPSDPPTPKKKGKNRLTETAAAPTVETTGIAG